MARRAEARAAAARVVEWPTPVMSGEALADAVAVLAERHVVWRGEPARVVHLAYEDTVGRARRAGRDPVWDATWAWALEAADQFDEGVS